MIPKRNRLATEMLSMLYAHQVKGVLASQAIDSEEIGLVVTEHV
jgi:hypothetical protein